MRKNYISIAIALSAVTLLGGCSSSNTNSGGIGMSETPINGSFKTTVLNAGKADAIILKTENHCAIIDTGEKGDGKEILEKLSEYSVGSVDYMFITHFDQDHVGGAPKLIKNISIDSIITPDYAGNNSEYEKFIETCAEKEKTPTRLKENMSFTLDDVVFEVYPPMQSSYAEDDNDFSLVIKVKHGSNTLLFTGDAEKERLSELYSQIGDLKADLLKMPHHGRYCKGTEKLIKTVNPKYAVITCSEDEGADNETLALLDNVSTFLTTGGEIVIISDGTNMSVTQEVPAEAN